MARFELQWSMEGSAVIEADDADEAEQILTEGLANLDATLFDELDVDEVSADETTEQED